MEPYGDETWTASEQQLMSEIERLAKATGACAKRVSAWIDSAGDHALRGIARAVPPGLLFTAALELTPRHGEIFLSHRKPNRRERVVPTQALTRDMANWNWQLNGQTMAFASETGEMEDGSHRSRALASAPQGTCIRQAVAFGVEESETIDTGIVRSLADHLTLGGTANAGLIAALAVRMESVEHDCFVLAGKTRRKATRQELLAYLEKHPEFAETAHRASTPPDFTPPSIAATALTLLSRAASGLGHPDWADLFYESWKTGAYLETGNPILMLTKTIAKRRILRDGDTSRAEKRQAPTADEVLALVMRAWNNWVTHEHVTMLKLPRGGVRDDNFPLPEGYKQWKKGQGVLGAVSETEAA